MNLLQLLQQFAARTGIPVLSSVIGNTDPMAVQLLGLLNEIIEDLMDRGPWTALTQETVFTTVDGEDQGIITTLAPNGFKFVIDDTIFNRTLRLPVFGPISAAKWQQLKALPTTGPFYKYRILRGHLLFNPVGIAGQTCAFEYASNWCMLAVDGVTYRMYPQADTDTFLLDSTLFLAGLRWKWKYEKGLDYAEDFRRYEEMTVNNKSRDGTKPTLSMSAETSSIQPGIFVPSGNWNV